MILSLHESAAFYGAPLSVQPICRYDLKRFVFLALGEGEGRLRNLLPFILARQAAERPEIFDTFNQWVFEDPSFRICWEFTRLALHQVMDQHWSEEDRDRWRRLCQEAGRIGIEPERALANLRRFLQWPIK